MKLKGKLTLDQLHQVATQTMLDFHHKLKQDYFEDATAQEVFEFHLNVFANSIGNLIANFSAAPTQWESILNFLDNSSFFQLLYEDWKSSFIRKLNSNQVSPNVKLN